MGQVALGFRSLLFKLAVFSVMAAMLAWILGGTLFPRPVTAMQSPSLEAGPWTWSWQAEIQPDQGSLAWHLVRRSATDDTWVRLPAGGPFVSVEPLQQADLAISDEDLDAGVLFRVEVWSAQGPSQRHVLRVDTNGTATPIQRAPSDN
jgi:hypothetical protein